MMEQPTDDEIRLTKWFDGELSGDEISDLLAADPELFRQRMEIEKLGAMIRLHASPGEESPEPPFPDLFNRQVFRRISENPVTRLRAWVEMFIDWFNSSHWALPATSVFALAVILLSGTRFISPDPAHSEVLHTFAPHPGHKASSLYHPVAATTIIRLEGLEAVAPSKSIIGFLEKPNDSSGDLATVVHPFRGAPSSPGTASPVRVQLVSSSPR
jgi:hypothetical protein